MRRLAAALGLAFALALAFSQPVSADGVDRTYLVGEEPFAIAIDPTDGRVFIGRQVGTDRLVALDPASGEVTAHATTGTPNYFALDPIHRRLYISNANGPVDVIDLTTMTIEATLPIGGTGIAVDPATRRVYVAGATDLWVIDGATNTVVASRPALTGQSWVALGIDPALHHVYVSNIFAWDDGVSPPVYRSLVVLDDRDLSVVADIRTDMFVRYALAVDQVRHRVFLAESTSLSQSRLAAFDGATLTQLGSVVLPGFAGGIAVGPDLLYMTALGTGYHVVDPQTLEVRNSFTTSPLRPNLPALHPDGRLYMGIRNLSGPDSVVAVSGLNHGPVIGTPFLVPNPPTTNEVIRLVPDTIDGDFGDLPSGTRDALSFVYEWARNGVVLPGETASTLDLSRAGNGERGDTITARFVATDPEGLSASGAAAPTVIANASPTATVSLSATAPLTDDVITVTAAASDPDGDAVTFSYEWTRNGVLIVGATTSSLDLASHGDAGDVILVRVRASDGHGAVATATASARVAFTIPNSGTFLYMNSQPGDYVGAGTEALYTSANSKIWGGAFGGSFSANIYKGTTDRWSIRLDAPFGGTLGVGHYPGAVRSPGQSNTPMMSFSGNGRGCNTLTGQFTVTELTYNAYAELMLIDATFEQHCEGAVPALFGRIRLEIPPPTPGVTLPQGTITLPTSGNFLYVQSEDFSGAKYESLYTSPNYVLTGSLKSGGDYFRGSVLLPNRAQLVMLDIAAPPGEPLTASSYIRAIDAHGQRVGRPGISLSSCGAIGEFVVDELVFAPTGELLVLQVTFEEYCNAGPLARFGRMRVEAPAPRSPITLPTGSITPPTTGNFLYVNSQLGDHAGQWTESLFLPAGSAISGSLSLAGDYLNGQVFEAPGQGFSRWWYVRIAAPPGQTLALGSYVGAARADFRESGEPGLEVTGSLGLCSTVLGRFDVEELTRWSNGEIRTFQATFEQHCDYRTAALFGRFRLETTPPIALGLTIREDGSVTNKTIVATIKGTVTCSGSTPVDLTGSLIQNQARDVVVTGTFSVRVDCTAPSVAWSVNVQANSGKFMAGSASATVGATACAPERQCVSATATRSVKLNLGK